MISVRPDNDAGRALVLIGRYPGEYDGPRMADELWPRKQPAPRFNSPAEYAAWRREHIVVKQVPRAPKRSTLKALSGRARKLPPTHVVRLVDDDPRPAKASRMLSRLQEQGLVETAGGPHASDWFAAKVAAMGLERALAGVLLCAVDDVPPALLRMVRRVVENPPGSVEDLLGPRPSGRKRDVYRAACEPGIIIPPSRRSLTESGRALVASWSTP